MPGLLQILMAGTMNRWTETQTPVSHVKQMQQKHQMSWSFSDHVHIGLAAFIWTAPSFARSNLIINNICLVNNI